MTRRNPKLMLPFEIILIDQMKSRESAIALTSTEKEGYKFRYF